MYYKSNPQPSSVATIPSSQNWNKQNQNSKSQSSFKISQNLSSKKTLEMLQLNSTNNNTLLKFTVPTFARVNLDKINTHAKPATKPTKMTSEKKKQSSMQTQAAQTTTVPHKKNTQPSRQDHEAYNAGNDSGLLNPLIEQLLKDLPSVNPSELGTGKIFENNNNNQKQTQQAPPAPQTNQENLNMTMTTAALLAESNRIAAKSQLAIKNLKGTNMVRLHQQKRQVS